MVHRWSKFAPLTPLAVVLLTSCAPKEPPAPTITAPPPTAAYVPQADFCFTDTGGSVASPLCPVIPGDIGPNPAIAQKVAYNGILGGLPTSAATDPQTPFDNLSWQTFVALNWTAGAVSQPAQQGLQGSGLRVWQSWPRVADIFGNSPVQANCNNIPAGAMVFSIASNGQGKPGANNEEYIQAATGDPLIDVSGNWTIYERRVNDIEVSYLQAPRGNKSWNLTNLAGQGAFVKAGQTVDFPSIRETNTTGAIELKAAWRVLDPAQRSQNQTKYFVVPAFLMVAQDLVTGGQPICAPVDMGLVAMHIIQKNPVTDNALEPEWFWSTFEHVDNAPLAQNACDPANPGGCVWFGNLNCRASTIAQTSYSFYSPNCPHCAVNAAPTPNASGTPFSWNPSQPYAKAFLTPTENPQAPTVGTQVSRCYDIYTLTSELNQQWRSQLAAVGSVFQNYMLIGTQWGASLTDPPNPKFPQNAVPSLLSNSVVETYLQTLYDPQNPFGTGSCISCHTQATLPVDNTTSANLSFLPDLAQPGLTRKKLVMAKATTPSGS